MKITVFLLGLLLFAGCQKEQESRSQSSPSRGKQANSDKSQKDDTSLTKYEIAGISDVKSVRDMLSRIQRTIGSGDKEAVASMVAFPIWAYVSGKSTEIRDKKAFLKHYAEIINANVKEAVAKQQADELFFNYQGVMIGDGQVWFGSRGDDLRIIAINN